MSVSPSVEKNPRLYLWGAAAATFVAVVATFVAPFVPLAGAPVVAIVLGILCESVLPMRDQMLRGLRFSAKYILQAAIIVSGFGISLRAVAQTGLTTLPVTVATMAVALSLAAAVGRVLKLPESLRTMIGVGTAICGASAIAAVATVLIPAESDIAVAIATVFAYNIAAVLSFPAVGHVLHLSQDAFGIWAGTAVNDTSSVVAAGYTYGRQAGDYATIVKLTRATLILPVVAAVAFLHARKTHGAGHIPWRRIVPWFIVWFLGAACVNSTGVIPPGAHALITATATFLISIALAAIGLQTKPKALVTAGLKPLFFGGVLWVTVAVTSLIVQNLTGL